MDISSREKKEIEAYEEVLSGSQVSDENLKIGRWTIDRYSRPYEFKRLPVDLLFKVLGDVKGANVLDCGCGDGEFTTIIAMLGANATGVDISSTLTATANRRAAINGVSGRTVFLRASVHELPLQTGSFDLVFGKGVLHHVDMELSSTEISRVLKKGGRAVFEEPIALSRAMLKIRRSRLITTLVKENRITPDEEPLTAENIKMFAENFSSCDIREVEFFSRLERVVGTGRIYEALSRVDAGLFAVLPALKRFGRLAIMEFTK